MGGYRWLLLLVIGLCALRVTAMSNAEKSQLRNEAKEMFFHAFNSYMTHAYPADELKPLSCSGRYRGVDASRGDVDEAMGNFAMTLIDSLDTLVVLGELKEFSDAIKRVIYEVSFANDVVVSVFETNIRVLGGLLSAHCLAVTLKAKHEPSLSWYNNQLLHMAQDLGDRLLPAFQTKTGIPYPRVNLLSGLSRSVGTTSTTCTACAGTMLLEFATLSRLTGNVTYELKARQAMDALWQRRSPHLLVGTTIDVNTGDWREQDSGVGAGIDSYYEYCLKAYVLLGDAEYLDRFNRHYGSVMNYVRRGNTLVDVHMYNPSTVAQSFVDSLGAFWPGLQVLAGDVSAAVDLFSHMEFVVKRHKFMPEAYSVDGDGFWWHHFLRPEFAESAYSLYQATGDDHYLEVGKTLLRNIQQHARVDCGFSAFSDLRTMARDDRMDSFVLAETFKYLYLLFASKEDIPVDLDDYVFSTEAHLLPLSVAKNLTGVKSPSSNEYVIDGSCTRVQVQETGRGLDYSSLMLHIGLKPEPSSVEQKHSNDRSQCANVMKSLRLLPENFNADNEEHVLILKDMGITIKLQGQGQMQLLHNSQQAKTPAEANNGIHFMQAMIQLNAKIQAQQADIVHLTILEPEQLKQVLIAGGARFGPSLQKQPQSVFTGQLVQPVPTDGCSSLEVELTGCIALIRRGSCMFITKVMHAEAAGAVAVVIYDYEKSNSPQLISMTGNGSDVAIPSAFLLLDQALPLLDVLSQNLNIVAKIEAAHSEETEQMAGASSTEPAQHAAAVSGDAVSSSGAVSDATSGAP